MKMQTRFVRDAHDDERTQAAYVRERQMHKTKDTLLDTKTILRAEPGPTISNRGTRWTGNDTPETDAIAKGMALAIRTLSPADRARVWVALERYAATGWKVNGDGSVTTDRGGNLAGATLRGIRDATSDVARQMNAEAAKYWAGNR